MSHDRVPRNGRTARELTQKTGLSERTICAWTAEPREAGLSMRAISKEVGIAVSAVHYALQKDQAA